MINPKDLVNVLNDFNVTMKDISEVKNKDMLIAKVKDIDSLKFHLQENTQAFEMYDFYIVSKKNWLGKDIYLIYARDTINRDAKGLAS